MDQANQLDTYIGKVEGKSVNKANIYVVYLTLFGGSPSSDSLCSNSKNALGDRLKENNYDTDIIPWLIHNVLPECKYNEKKLTFSLELYIDYLYKMLGIHKYQAKLAGALKEILKKNGISAYNATKDLLNKVPDDSDGDTLREAINSVLRDYEHENIFLNENLVADHLKWILKNDPKSLYKNMWKDGNFQPFNTIEKFIHKGHKYVLLEANIDSEKIQIHLQCTPEGVKKGPYLVKESIKKIASICDIDKLKNNDFLIEENSYKYPFKEFIPDNGLIAVALHIKEMIEKLREAGVGR